MSWGRVVDDDRAVDVVEPDGLRVDERLRRRVCPWCRTARGDLGGAPFTAERDLRLVARRDIVGVVLPQSAIDKRSDPVQRSYVISAHSHAEVHANVSRELVPASIASATCRVALEEPERQHWLRKGVLASVTSTSLSTIVPSRRP